MPHLERRLQAAIAAGQADPALLEELHARLLELQQRHDQLETLLIMLVRTGWPWQEDGTPNELFHAARDGYASAIGEARELLGLERSRLTRTEPKT